MEAPQSKILNEISKTEVEYKSKISKTFLEMVKNPHQDTFEYECDNGDIVTFNRVSSFPMTKEKENNNRFKTFFSQMFGIK